jgi:hypothetical protein
VQVADDWFEVGAPPPSPPNVLPVQNGFSQDWDYAVIRLAESMARERGYARLEAIEVPPVDGRLWISQFPDKQALVFDTHSVKGTYGNQRERFYYTVNTDDGSSGGPCLDNDFRLVGIHLAAWIRGGALIGNDKVNLGVPIVKVLDHLKSNVGGVPAPKPRIAALRRLRNRSYPIVGRWDFQSRIWTDLVPGREKRIITVTGPLGRGKSFLADILASMLPISAHLIVNVSVEALAKETAQACYTLLRAKLGPSAEVAEAAPPGSVAALRSTPSALLRDHLVPSLIEHADRLRADRTVWFVIDDFDLVTVDGREAGDYLYLLYETAARTPWLRFVLLGFRGDLAAFGAARSFVVPYVPAPLSTMEINEHLHHLISEHQQNWGDDAIAFQANTIAALAGDPMNPDYAKKVAEGVMDFELRVVTRQPMTSP